MRVLSVNHGPSVPGGVFDDAVEASGHRLERWSVPLGGAPAAAREYDAVMVFGGSMHPDQDADFHWLGREEEFLQEVLSEEVPVIGVCLGAQMLARSAGGRVGPARAPEVGWLDVELSPAGRGDPVLGVLPARATWLQWHHYTFEIPAGGTELARSEICPQAYKLRQPAWGIQFHAEVTLPMVTAWLEEGPKEDLPVSAEDLVRETRARIETSSENGRLLATAFLGVAAAVR